MEKIAFIIGILAVIIYFMGYQQKERKKTILLLIRHGMSRANIEGRFAGQTDVELTEDGIKQAEETAEYIANNYKVNKVYASDLIRAYKTGEYIANKLNLTVVKHKGLREINAGKWHGKKFEDITEEFGKEYDVWRNDIGNSKCPGGESAKELGERVMNALTEIATENVGKTVVIATHATPIRIAQTMIQHKILDEMKNVPWVSNASVTTLEYLNGEWKCVKVSEDGHLSFVSCLRNV